MDILPANVSALHPRVKFEREFQRGTAYLDIGDDSDYQVQCSPLKQQRQNNDNKMILLNNELNLVHICDTHNLVN